MRRRWHQNIRANSPCCKAKERRVHQNFCGEISEYDTPMFKWHDTNYTSRNLAPQSTKIFLPQIGVAECRTWKQLVSQGEHAEEIVMRFKAEEKENKPRQEKSAWRTPEQSFQSKRKDTLASKATSSTKSQLVRGGNTSGQMCANKQYSFKDEHVVSLFKLLHKSKKLKLREAKCPEEVSKTNDPNYFLSHRMVGHPIKSCYIFKDSLQALIDVDVLKLCQSKRR